MKQKGLAPIVIILLIAAATFGYLVYSGKINLNQTTTQVSQPSPTANETANWKTYTNKDVGYSIKYPDDWYVYELKNYPYQGFPGVIEGSEVIVTTFPKFPKFSAGGGSGDQYIGMDIIKTESNITKPVDTKYPNGEKDKIEEVNLNGIMAYKVTQPDKDIRWLIPSSKGGVIITVLERSSTSDYMSKIDQILSTFKFTN